MERALSGRPVHSLSDVQPLFRSCELAAWADSPWAVPYERHVPVFLCRGAHRSVQELWPQWEGEN